MKKYLLFTTCLCFAVQLNAQNWNFIQPSERYHFQHKDDTLPLHTILIDSSRIEESITTSYLNRLFFPCDTCSEEGLYLDNQPSFMQREFVYSQVSSTVVLTNPDTYTINLPDNDETEWWFDEAKTQKANIASVIKTSVFGVDDSVATINIDGEPQIMIAKKLGLLKYFDYELSGMENAGLGICLPGWKEFYDFKVGDVFQYKESAWNMQVPCTYLGVYKKVVSNIQYNVDSVIIDWSIKSLQWYDPYACGTNDSMPNVYDWEYTQIITKSDISNTYPCQLVEFYSFAYGVPYYELTENGIALNYNTEKDVPPYTGIITYDENSGYTSNDDSYFLKGLNYRYESGLGLVKYYRDLGVDGWQYDELIGYVKGTDTTGVVYMDDFYVIDTTTIDTTTNIDYPLSTLDQVSIYPNPSQGSIIIDLGSYKSHAAIKIYSVCGELIREQYFKTYYSEDLSNLKSGIYIIKVETEYGNKQLKWIKQ
ncbi:MAG: T9SS type A sorting domain-containing protein [Salinivirgaceae bacterium]|jgi:hypothetical protein|nr:T9SS type A sorting domain-containing protein [Salinivirgaceae bacterium]